MVSVIETIIVNFTSPAARSPFPSEPANGYAKALKMLLIRTSHITNDFASGEIAEWPIISGVIANTSAFQRIDNNKVILLSFLK